jgi:hypothetical protein
MKTLRTLVAAALAAAGLSAHAVGQLADITIHDRATGRDLPVYWHEGRAYVVGKPGNEYQINVKSRSGDDLLAIMSVDGVNVISGRTASATQGGGYVLSAWENASIRGWRKSMEEVAAFYFTSLGDSYAARTGRPDNVGVIGVALFQRKRVEPEPFTYAPPASEPWAAKRRDREERGAADSSAGAPAQNKSLARAAPSAPLGTGHGRREESRTTYTAFERSTEKPVETIAIYYDSYRNLVAQGVLPTYGYGRRDPDPWPTGFVPNPR